MTVNPTPRKCLKFRSPVEAFLAELGNDIKARFNIRLGSGIHVARTHRTSGLSHIASVRTRRSVVQKGLEAGLRCDVA